MTRIAIKMRQRHARILTKGIYGCGFRSGKPGGALGGKTGAPGVPEVQLGAPGAPEAPEFVPGGFGVAPEGLFGGPTVSSALLKVTGLAGAPEGAPDAPNSPEPPDFVENGLG